MLTGGMGSDTLTGGANNDVYVYAGGDAPAGENIVEAASGGTDRITTTATADLSALTVNGAADLSDASSLGIEQIVIQSGSTATFSGAQLNGNSIAINESAAGTTNLVINLASGATNDFGSLSFGAFSGGDAFDNGGDTFTINGAAGSEIITATSIAATINAGAGADKVKINAGTTPTTWTVDLGSGDAAADQIVFNHAAIGDTHNTVAVVSNFAVANDKVVVTMPTTATSITDGTFATITADNTNVAAGTEVVEIAINNAARVTATLTGDGNGATIETIITAAINDIPLGNYTFIVYSSTNLSTADAGIYTVHITDNTNPGTGGMTVEHIMTLAGVGFGNLSSSNFGAFADPIVFDLGAPGLDFTNTSGGVSFDMNGDGRADQVAWTTGEDGILALDVDGSGTIDNGTEIFSPFFPDGTHASGLAALASLDSNDDGVIDSADNQFGNLLIWQDLNHNGFSEADELFTLTAHGITGINLNATPADGEINGQQLLVQGTFNYADGSTGSFVEVDFDAVLGQPENLSLEGSDGNDILIGGDGYDMLAGGMGADTLTGGANTDTFVFAGADGIEPDTVTDYTVGDASAGGDVLDISDLLTDSGYTGDAATLQNFVAITESSGNTIVSVDADGAGSAVAQTVVTLQGVTNVTLQDLLNNNQIVA